MNVSEAENAIREGVAAMRSRDADRAKALFQTVIASGAVAPPWILLAQACNLAGDVSEEEAALDSLLSVHPRDIRGLIMRGDCYARNGDTRAAASFYKTALQTASGRESIPPSLGPELRRAELLVVRAEEQFSEELESHLSARGFGAIGRTARFQESLDILGGRSEVFFQQPTSYYFPRLPQIQFYERSDFPWIAALEDAAPAMRAELEAVMEEDAAFSPYIEPEPDRPSTAHEMAGDPNWSAFHLWKNGALVPENAARCPRTIKALEAVPMPRIADRSPMALFSLLRPGTHIPPHHGLLNTRLICHIPLIVPPDCRLRVGNETRVCEEGKALIFDDSIEHEAWNGSDRTRVILLFEIWRPEITLEERAALTAMFEAITAFRGEALEG